MRPLAVRTPRKYSYPKPLCSATRPAALLLSLVLAAAHPLPAQTTAPQADTPAALPKPADMASAPGAGAEDDMIVLSPFEVNTSKDRGFAAVNAGTATKLGLDLKDLAAPYSVMTGEFIRTMGITDIRSAVFWSTGGSQVFDGQGSDPFGLNGANTVTTSTMYSIRGQTMNAGQQRNFFLTGSMGDTYNIERIDFGRGPNAVLFNVGANNVLGGGISTQGKRARLDDDFTTVSALGGSWDYYRSTLDVNRHLTDNLAVRANLMEQKRGGWMEDEFEDRSGATLAATYRLAPRTELRIEGIYDTTQRATVPFPYFDVLSGWNGAIYFSGPLSEQIMTGAAATGNGAYLETRPGVSTYQAGSREGIARVTSPQYIWDPATNTLQNWIHTAVTRRGDENEWVPLYLGNTVFDRAGNGAILPFGNSNANAAGNRQPAVNQNGGQAAFLDMINLPANRFDRQMANSKFTVPDRRFSAMPDMPLYTQRWNDLNASLTHAFTDSLFLELSGDWNRLHEGASNAHLNLRFGLIDINQIKPDGTPNPNFRKAYSQTNNGLQFNCRTMTNWGMRANLGYIKDLRKWGHYTFNLTASETGRDSFSTQKVFSTGLSQDLPAAFNHPAGVTDPRQWHAGNNQVIVRYYWDGSDRPSWGNLQPTSLFDRVPTTTNGVTTYATGTKPVTTRWVLSDWAAREERTASAILAFAARYFDNKLILSPGVRFDRHTTYIRNRPVNWGTLPDDPTWGGLDLTDSRYWRPDAPRDWKSYVPTDRPVIGGVNDVNRPNPLADDKRYRSDYNNPRARTNIMSSTAGATYHLFSWLALKASYGESYLPGAVARYNLKGEDVDPEVGKSLEGAVTFSLFNDRLAITPRYYHDLQENRLGFPVGAINDLMGRRAYTDNNATGRNPFGLSNVPGNDFFTTKNDGIELEMVGNITRGWRVMANFGTAQATDLGGRFPASGEYVLSRLGDYKQVLEAAGGSLDTTAKPQNAGHAISAAPGIAIPNAAISDAAIRTAGGDPAVRQAAVNDYNNIWVQYDNYLLSRDVETLANKYQRINIFTDYTIQSGRWKGLTAGLGWQYSDQVIAGYYSAQTIANPNYNAALPVSSTNLQYIDDPAVDVNSPVYAKRPSEVTLTLGYERRLPKGWGMLSHKKVSVQLTVRNLLNAQNTFYQDDGIVNRPPNGDPSKGYRVTVVNRVALYQRPINFELQTTLSF